jgi:tRNA nucleotidyltransferase/poly(A) polymerase
LRGHLRRIWSEREGGGTLRQQLLGVQATLSEVGSEPLEAGAAVHTVGRQRNGVGQRHNGAGRKRNGVGQRGIEVGRRRNGVGRRCIEVGQRRIRVGQRRTEAERQRNRVGKQRNGHGRERPLADTIAPMPLHSFRLLLHQPAVRALIAAADGVELHLVGGALRDRALGLPVHDFDAVVSGRGKEISERLAEILPARLVLLGGKEFAAYRLVGEDVVVDIWDRAGTSLHQDLARRDFTVNSFAFDLRTQEISDPFNGLSDLGRRTLRATTSESFSGDPLRVLRLPRLLLKLPGFTAEPDTLLLARRSAPGLSEVAAERVRDELALLFGDPDAARGLTLLMELDLYPGLWLGRPGEPGRPGLALAEIGALPEAIRELRGGVDTRIACLASLFANLPEPSPTIALERFRDAGYLTRSMAADIARLLELPGLPEDEISRRRFLHRTGTLWPTAAAYLSTQAAAHGRPWRPALAPLVDLARREGATLIDPPRLLGGAEVQEILGIPPGPGVGRALGAVLAAQVDGKVRTREEAVALLRAM